MKPRTRFLGLAAFWLWISLTSVTFPQEKDRKPAPPAGNVFTRITSTNYAQPQVIPFESKGEASLDAMIKDGKLELSQEDVVRLALENNVDINVERYSPYFSVWGIERGKAILNPVVQFNTNINRNVTPATSLLQGGTTVLSLANVYDLTVHKPFEPGLDVDFEFRTTRARTNNSFTSLNPYLTPLISIGLTQHLLKDQGRITRSRGIRIARNNAQISEDAFTAKVSDLLTNVLNTYWDLVFNEEDVKLKETALKLAQVVLEQNKIQADVGTMAPLDVVQAEAEVASRNQQLVVARFNRKIAENQVKKLISSRTDPGLIEASIVTISKPAIPATAGPDVAQAVQRALESRPEVKQALLDLENRKVNVDFAKNQLRPAMDLVASYSQNGLGGKTILRDFTNGFFGAPVIGITPGGFLDSLSSLFSQRYLGYAIGLNLRLPIGNDDARANSAQAQIDYRQGEERLRSLRQSIALEIRQAYDRLALNQASLQAAEVTVRYQKQRLQGEEDKYSLGANTTRSIIEAQRDLQDAQTTFLKAQIETIKSRIALDKALGETFSAHNIEPQDALRGSK
jgi:outer membrane protein